MFGGYATEFNGDKLYKYYSYSPNMCEMFAPVLNNTLRYRTPNSFNDPYDCYIARTLNGNIEAIRKREMEGVFVSSLTTSDENLLMWTHYASEHKGFVVEYDTQKLKSIDEPQMETFSYVKYEDDIVIKDFIKEFVNPKLAEEVVVKAIFHKSSCWSYENEIRSVLYGRHSDNNFIDINLPEDSISAIILGSHFFVATKCVVPSCLKQWKENGKLFYMQLASDAYKLERRDDIQDGWFKTV